MLQRCPEVHGNGANLHLHRHKNFPFLQENRNLNHNMQAAIPIGLGLLNIIPPLHHPHIVLLDEQVCNGINIVNVGADDPNACNVCELLGCRFNGQRNPLSAELFRNGGQTLHAGLHVMNGVPAVLGLEFIIQNFQLRLHFTDGRLIPALNGKIVLHNFLKLLR